MKRKAWRTLLSLLLVALFIAQPVLAAVPPAEPKDPDVILAYKTHCDIGFTDYVTNVLHK